MTTDPNDVLGSRGPGAAKAAQEAEAKGQASPSHLGESAWRSASVSNPSTSGLMTARHPLIDSSPRAPQQARGSKRAANTTSAPHGRQIFGRQLVPEMRILLITQAGLIADGLARSLAQIGKGAQVTVCDPDQTAAAHPVPKLVVLDVDAALDSAANLVARFIKRYPSTPIVAMGSMLDESLMTASIQAGAKAYLPKTYSESQAIGVLRVVLEGSASGPDSGRETINKESAIKNNSQPRQGNPYSLTKAEIEVLSLLCEGLTSFEIAKQRGGKEGTIKAHLAKIYPKLRVPNRLGAQRIGQRLYEVQQCQLARTGDQASVRGWLLPHMKLESKRKGELLFHKGDPGRTLYFIQQGRVALPEIGVEMSDGELFGEIGIFTPAHTRSFTARCETDTKLFCLGADEATRLFFEHPQFAYHVMQLMARRLQADSTRTR
jgi:DNA-binding NarL/FixJ family response regulator